MPTPLLPLQRLFQGAVNEEVSVDEAWLGALWEQVGEEAPACACGILTLLPEMGEKGQGDVQLREAAVGGYVADVAKETVGRLGSPPITGVG